MPLTQQQKRLREKLLTKPKPKAVALLVDRLAHVKNRFGVFKWDGRDV